MTFSTEGIVFRDSKTASGRRVILLFTKDHGKISVGTRLNEGGRSKSALAIKPFTLGEYQIFEGRDYYNLVSCDTRRSFYSLGEDIARYAAASYVLELTDKLLPEDMPQPRVYSLLTEFLDELEGRKGKYETLVLAYEVKMMSLLGVFPVLDRCASCGKVKKPYYFSIKDGGIICGDCYSEYAGKGQESLIFSTGFDIVEVINYFADNPLRTFSGVALGNETAAELQKIIKEYLNYHFDLGNMKSEGLFSVLTEGAAQGVDK